MIIQLKNNLHSLIKQNGYKLKKESLDTKGMKEKILQLDFSGSVKIEIELLYKHMEAITNSRRSLRKPLLFKVEYSKEEIRLLTSIKGIILFMAIGIMSDVADVNRFPGVKNFCSYLRSGRK